MRHVTVRDLRNHGADVLDRVAAGERLTVTRDGRPIAELRPVRRLGLASSALVDRWKRLPHVDPRRLRTDVDDLLDQRL